VEFIYCNPEGIAVQALIMVTRRAQDKKGMIWQASIDENQAIAYESSLVKTDSMFVDLRVKRLCKNLEQFVPLLQWPMSLKL
jgi:hypothetical protein